MFTHQRPAIASRYSVPSASTTVEPRPATITRGSASSWRWATTGCSTLSRSCLTTAARPSTWAGVGSSGFVMPSPCRVLAWIIRRAPDPAAAPPKGLGVGDREDAPGRVATAEDFGPTRAAEERRGGQGHFYPPDPEGDSSRGARSRSRGRPALLGDREHGGARRPRGTPG